MKKSLILALTLAAALVGCGGTGTVSSSGPPVLSTPIAVGASPEQQIATGADAVKAVTGTATVLLRDHKITVTQAKSFRNMLAAAGESLKDANGELVTCRASTASTPTTAPDPCWPKVSDVVGIALANIASVKTALDAK